MPTMGQYNRAIEYPKNSERKPQHFKVHLKKKVYFTIRYIKPKKPIQQNEKLLKSFKNG